MRRLRLLWAVLAAGVVIAACFDGTPSSAPPATEPSTPAFSGTPAPRWPLEDLLGTWTLSSTLTLNPDGTYEIVSVHGADSGRWLHAADEEILRLTSRDESDMCERFDRTRMSIEVTEQLDGSGARLALDRLREDCFTRSYLGTIYGAPSLGEDLSGTWSTEATITIDPESYTIETLAGRDTGVFEYFEGDRTLELESTGGDLCPGGSRTSLRADHARWASGDVTVEFAVTDGDCAMFVGVSGVFVD